MPGSSMGSPGCNTRYFFRFAGYWAKGAAFKIKFNCKVKGFWVGRRPGF